MKGDVDLTLIDSIYWRHPSFSPDTPQVNVDTTLLPQCALDVEDVPPPIPPKQLSNDDVLRKYPESRELQEGGRDTPPPKTNQEDITAPPRPPKISQHTIVSH